MEFPPQYLIDKKSWSATGKDGSEVDRALDGTPRIRRMWPTMWRSISFDVVCLAEDDVADLQDFYWANRSVYIDFTDPITMQAMSALMLSEPEVVNINGNNYTMRVTMEAKYQ